MGPRTRAVLSLIPAGLLLACRFEPEPPELPRRARAAPAASSSAPAAPAVEAAPPLLRGRAAPVVHLQITLPPGLEVASDTVALVKGTLSDAALRGLAQGALPASSRQRAVPALVATDGGRLRVFPSAPLERGASYTLAVAPLGLRHPLLIADQAPPTLPRLWPPLDDDSPADLAIFCGPDPLPAAPAPLGFGPDASVERGAPGGLGGPRCLAVRAPDPGGPWPLPAAVAGTDGALSLLSPAPLRRGPRPPAPPPACQADEVPFGPGCLLPLDDRAVWNLPAEPWLVLREGEAPRPAARRAVLRGLTPSSSALVEAAALDLRGELHRARVAVETQPPRVHVVITEVLADPEGAEPAGEWIELYNDGSTGVTLEGHTLDDGQGSTALPPITLAPGAFALVAGADFAAPPGLACPVARVPRLGKGGLSNQGEPLALRDASGALLSSFPSLPRPRPGRSVERLRPEALDDDPASFALSPGKPTPCAPAAP